jgi:diadenosine tetraphosphatase ApaH/serine/threonine PP2A family protein phosphatase
LIAVISDIHANLEALEAVLTDASREDVEGVICLGDVVGYGADPNRCIDRVKLETRVSLLGNHDAAACDIREAENFNEVAREAILWTQSQLTSKNREILESAPLDFVQNGARFVHASPNDPAAWHYILTEQEAWDAFAACPEPICFVGHSHVPLKVLLRNGRLELHDDEILALEDEVRCLVNVGSVGQPRDGDARASYALFDPKAHRVILRRVAYDIEKASSKILAAGLPEILARRLAHGQ